MPHIINIKYITPVAPGLSYVRKVAHLQVVVVVKAVWGIFNDTNNLYLQVNTLFVIYKSRYYSIHLKLVIVKLYAFIKSNSMAN